MGNEGPREKPHAAARSLSAADLEPLVVGGLSRDVAGDHGPTVGDNLYCDLLELIGRADPALDPPPATYAVTCRGHQVERQPRFAAWAYPLAVGRKLPTLPIWLTDDLAVSLDLEAGYEQTCRALRIPAA
jgi:hypothetical protein